jgi:probable phosphoglycerate mutase
MEILEEHFTGERLCRRDIDYGTWQLQTFEEVQKAEPELFNAWFATPHLMRFSGGETIQEVAARAADWLKFALARHVNETVVLVGHDSMNRVLLLQLLDQPQSLYLRLAQDPCCIHEIDVINGRIIVARMNETAHLASIDSQ